MATAGSVRTSAPMALRLGRVTIPLSIWLPLAIFALTRLYGVVIITWAAGNQVALPSPDHPGIYQSCRIRTRPAIWV